MINQTHSFGARLKSAREALGMERKEIASQLRLHEKIIVMIENGEFKTDIPMTFIRGYIRSYSKLVGLPEKELHDAMESMKPKQEPSEEELYQASAQNRLNLSGPSSMTDQSMPFNTDNIFMKLFTLILLITVIGLAGIWWHSKSTPNHKSSITIGNATIATPLPETGTAEAIPEQKPVAKVISKTNPEIFTQWLNKDASGSFLMNMIFFLIILTASMRIYVKPGSMAGMRSRSRRHVRSHFQTDSITRLLRLNLKASLQFLGVAAVLVAGTTAGIFWYKHAGKTSVIAASKQPVVAQQEEVPEDYFQSYVPVEILAPSSTLSSIMVTGIQPYAGQEIINQLHDYIAEAAAIKFSLTDRSTAIGQFVRKKSRRYRMQTQDLANSVPENNTGNVNQPETQYGNSTPPYYYNNNH